MLLVPAAFQHYRLEKKAVVGVDLTMVLPAFDPSWPHFLLAVEASAETVVAVAAAEEESAVSGNSAYWMDTVVVAAAVAVIVVAWVRERYS